MRISDVMTEITAAAPENQTTSIRLPGKRLALVMLVAGLAALVWICMKAVEAGYPVGSVILPSIVGAVCGAAVLAWRAAR